MKRIFKLPSISHTPAITTLFKLNKLDPVHDDIDSSGSANSINTNNNINTSNSSTSNSRISKIVNNSRNKIMPSSEYVMYFDGCSKGNPGKSGAGAVIYHNSEEIWSQSAYVGEKETNNYAEYHGLILGLNGALEMNINNLTVYGDSNLVINHLNGKYKISSENLMALYCKSMDFSEKFTNITFQHVYRTENSRADQLANDALNN
jgi:ribonuclease HI